MTLLVVVGVLLLGIRPQIFFALTFAFVVHALMSVLIYQLWVRNIALIGVLFAMAGLSHIGARRAMRV